MTIGIRLAHDVATADEQIFPGGTGFQCDVGMTGPYDSILGRNIAAVMEATLDAVLAPFQVATGDVRLSGTWVDVHKETGYCRAIGRLQVGEQTIQLFNDTTKASRKIL